MKVSKESMQTSIERLLTALPQDITPVERLILCGDGTVQTSLSMLFCVPVRVEVISQEQSPQVISRRVRLIAQYPDRPVTACTAHSLIPINSNSREFINAINKKELGIGEILRASGYVYERHISAVYADEYEISREYGIIGNDLYMLITEVFPRKVLAVSGEMI